ncbi:MAG TPA: hypothetical protein VGB70_12470 [Allosphingosinicella sp.]|jgi:hypothetical protein
MTDVLQASDFAAGDRFNLGPEGEPFVLTVIAVQELPRAAREGGAFRLELSGPVEPILAQATYRFQGERRSDDIFIVPIGSDEHGTRYEAIFV